MKPTLALVHWGNTIDDFLRPNRLDLGTFARSFVGSWMFGYVEALRAADADVVLFLFSEEIEETMRLRHEPTGARIVALPAPRAYRRLRRRMTDPYGRSAEQTFGRRTALNALRREAAPYLTTSVRRFARELLGVRRCALGLCAGVALGQRPSGLVLRRAVSEIVQQRCQLFDRVEVFHQTSEAQLEPVAVLDLECRLRQGE